MIKPDSFTAAFILAPRSATVVRVEHGGVHTQSFPRRSDALTVDALVLAARRFPDTGGVIYLRDADYAESDIVSVAKLLGEQGFSVGNVGRVVETRWMRVYDGPTPPFVIAFAPLNDHDYLSGILTDPTDLPLFLGMYQDATGAPWYSTPGLSGMVALRAFLEEGRKPRWSSPRPGGVAPVSELKWRGTPATGDEPVTRWDMRWARLNAAAAVALPLGQLAQGRIQDFADRDEFGYFKVSYLEVMGSPAVAALRKKGMPDGLLERLWGTTDTYDGGVWITTPVRDLLAEIGFHGIVLDSWTAPGGELLRPWAWAIRDALYEIRDEIGTPAGALGRALVWEPLKDTYRQACGMVATAGRSIYRPDWHDLWISMEKMLVMRRVLKVGRELSRWPAVIDVDELTYAGDDAWQIHALIGAGTKAGQMRTEEDGD